MRPPVLPRPRARHLTTPELVRDAQRYLPTGNHYLSIATLRASDAGAESVGVLLSSMSGLVELAGRPTRSEVNGGPPREYLPTGDPEAALLKPFLEVEGREVVLEGRLAWGLAWSWIPVFAFVDQGLSVYGTVFCPTGERGGYYVLEVVNRASTPVRVLLGVRGQCAQVRSTVFTASALAATAHPSYDRWSGSVVVRVSAGLPLLALAVGCESDSDVVRMSRMGDGACGYVVGSSAELQAGETRCASFPFSIAPEGDGASLEVVHLKRVGWQRALEATGRWLAARCRGRLGPAELAAAGEPPPRLCGLPLAPVTVAEPGLSQQPPGLAHVRDRNLFFCHFFSVGRFLDTDEVALATSRSPRYYVSSAFWGRDSLIWSLPAVLTCDAGLAAEALVTAFARHSRNAGVHAHYLNGTVLYPGFELDQLAAYPIAVDRHVKATGDRSVLGEPAVAQGLRSLLRRLIQLQETDGGLLPTELDPSDDPVNHPYLTYCNVLAWKAYTCLAGLLPHLGREVSEAARKLWEAIMQRCVAPGPFGPMFVWATEGSVAHEREVYDDPPGSLLLLPFWGFCPSDSAVWKATRSWILSPRNPYRYDSCSFGGMGSVHTPYPWVMSHCNMLLAGVGEEPVDFFARAEMDWGLACESVAPDTGRVLTGAAFAACAGYVAWALDYSRIAAVFT